MSEQRVSGRHQVNIGHLVMGLAFLGIVGIWALVESDTVTGDDIRWLMPIPWVVAGLAGLVAAAITGGRRYSVRQTGWVGEEPQPTVPAYRSPGERLGDLGRLSELKHLGDKPEDRTTEPEETAPLFTQRDETPTAPTDEKEQP